MKYREVDLSGRFQSEVAGSSPSRKGKDVGVAARKIKTGRYC